MCHKYHLHRSDSIVRERWRREELAGALGA